MHIRLTIGLVACFSNAVLATTNTSTGLINVSQHDEIDYHDDVQILRSLGNMSPIYSEITSSQTSAMTTEMGSTLNSTETAESYLLGFAKHLRSFIHERYFDFLCFERGIETLQNELTRVSIFVMYMIPRSREMHKRLVSESQKFGELQKASKLLRMYNFLGCVDHVLVSRMVELNVRLISLKTMDDKLDRSVKNYSLRIFEAWRHMCLYEEGFERLANISASITADFRFQLDKAAVTIEDLWSQVPEDEYDVDKV